MFKRYRFILALMVCLCVFSCGVIGTAWADATTFTKKTDGNTGDCSATLFEALKAALTTPGGDGNTTIAIDVTNITGLTFKDGKITATVNEGATSPFKDDTTVTLADIDDLTGIEKFTALQTLDVSGCTNEGLTTLNLTGLNQLKTLKYYCNVTTVTGYSLYVHSKQVILNGSINMVFYVPKANNSGTITATLSGVESGQHAQDLDDDNYYAFSCEVTSIQMADPITATITIGSKTVTFTGYTVKKYLDVLTADTTTYAKAAPLANAIKAYGYYAQVTLKDTNTEYGTHKSMDVPTGDYVIAESGLDSANTKYEEEHAMKIYDGDSSTVTTTPKVACTLDLDSKTTLHVLLPEGSKLRDANGKTGLDTISTQSSTYAINSTNVTTGDTKISSTTYFDIAFNYIAAQELADKFTIPVTIGETGYTIQVSAMSYVHSILSKTNSDLNTAANLGESSPYNKAIHLKQAVTALCKYGEETETYRND